MMGSNARLWPKGGVDCKASDEALSDASLLCNKDAADPILELSNGLAPNIMRF